MSKKSGEAGTVLIFIEFHGMKRVREEEEEALSCSLGSGLTLVNLILSHLSFKDLCNLGKTCKKYLWILDQAVYEKTRNTQTLFLQRKTIGHVSSKIFQLPRLTHLHLECNRLTSIPDAFSMLPNLLYLDLSSNCLCEFPAVLCDLVTLKFLFLNNNYLTEIPESIVQLTSLFKLNLSFNQLTAFPSVLSNMTHLRHLYLYHNLFPVY